MIEIGNERKGDGELSEKEVDGLVKAGFLMVDLSGGKQRGMFARPVDRAAMLSLETVSRTAAGGMEAFGGKQALGGGGGDVCRGRDWGEEDRREEWGCGLRIAVPGLGAFLELVSGTVEHLRCCWSG